MRICNEKNSLSCELEQSWIRIWKVNSTEYEFEVNEQKVKLKSVFESDVSCEIWLNLRMLLSTLPIKHHDYDCLYLPEQDTKPSPEPNNSYKNANWRKYVFTRLE